MAAADARKPLNGEQLKYTAALMQGYWLRNDGVVERRSHFNQGPTKLLHLHVPTESPWVMLSAGAEGGVWGASIVEMAWLRADGAVNIMVTASPAPNTNYESSLLHDFRSPVGKYTGRGHLVTPPAGTAYTAVAAGVRHVCGSGVAATYCLRSDGLVDRITTTDGGVEGGVAPLRRSAHAAPARETLSSLTVVKYVAVAPGYYVSYLVRADGAIDVLSETAAKGTGIMNNEVSQGGRLDCTIAAPVGTRYVGVAAHHICGKGRSDKELTWKLPPQVLRYFLRADGRVDITTAEGRAVSGTIEPPAAVRYVAGTSSMWPSFSLLALLRSDGAVDLLSKNRGTTTISPPAGLAYLGVCGSPYFHLVRNDGAIDELHIRTYHGAYLVKAPREPDAKSNTEFGTVLRSTAPSSEEVPVAGCCAIL